MKGMQRRLCALWIMVVGAAMLGGCATKSRELMPTPALFDQPAARVIFQEVPVERRTTFVDLLFITDRAPDTGSDAELPYGEERSRSLAFGSARVALLPQMEWDELKRHSLTDPREQPIELQVESIQELGRYPT